MKSNNKPSQQFHKAYTGSSFGLSSPQNNMQMNGGLDQTSNIRALVQKYQAFDSNRDEDEDNVYDDNNNDQQDNYDNEYEQDYEEQQMQIQQNQLQLQEQQNNQYDQSNNVFQSSGKSGQKMLLVNNANTTNNAAGNVVSYSTPPQQQQLINLNINNNNNSQQVMQQQQTNNVYNNANGQVNFFNSYHQNGRMNHLLQSSNNKKVSSNTKNSSYRYQIRTIRPQSAKPISKDRYQIQNGNQNESSALYGQQQQQQLNEQFNVFKNKTIKNDNSDNKQGGTEMIRYYQIKSKLNAKLGVPYLDSIKAIQRQDYGITMYQPKQMGTRIRPMSGKATQSTQQALQNISQDQMLTPSIQQQQQQQQNSQQLKKVKLHGNRSLTRRPSNDHQSIYVNLNMNLDKEQLYQASITLKGELNICLNENQNLKTQLQFLNKELINREKMLNEVITTGKLQNRMNDNTLLSFKLKQQLRELQQLMKTKDAEIELLKRNIRSTRLEEAEQIVQVYMQEGVRLRQQLTDALNMSNYGNLSATTSQHDQQSPQQRIQELNQMIQQLQLTLQGKEQEVQLWKQRCDKQLQQASEMSLSKSKIKSGNTSQYIQKDEYDHVKQKVRDLQNKYDELLLENQSLNEQVQLLTNEKSALIEKDDMIKQLQSEIQSQDQVIQIISDEKNQLQEQVNGFQIQNEKLKEKHNKQVLQLQDQISEMKEQLENQIQDNIQEDNDIEQLKQQHKSQLKEQIEKLKSKYNEELELQKTELTQFLNKTINEYDQKIKSMNQEHQGIINQLQNEIALLTNDLKIAQQSNQQQQISKDTTTQMLQRQFTKQPTNKSQQSVQDQQQQSIQSRRSVVTSNSNNSQYQIQRKSIQSNNLEKLPLVKEDQISKFYEKIKRVLQLEKIHKDQVSKYIFSDNLENREDISIKDFSQILYMKFQLDQKDALNFARFVIEQPSQQEQSVNEIEYNPQKTLVNRKLIKFLNDKVLGQSYQIFTQDQEQHVLKKYRELAQPHYDNLESTLSLYDEDERGIISCDDLREGLLSFDIYDGKDKISLECFTLYLLTLNHKNNDQIRIQDVLESLYPDRQVSVSKSSIISKKLTQNTAINRSITLDQQNPITQQKSTVRFMETQQSLKNQKTILKSSQHEIQEEINNNNNKIIDNDDNGDKNSNQIIEDDYDQDNYEQEEILSQQDINNNINPTLIKSMNEEELLQKSEIAFQLITQHLQKHNLSLRNILQNHIYDKKIAIIQHQQPIDEFDNVQINKQEVDQTFEVINAQDFFQQLKIEELSQPLQESVIQIAAKPLNDNTQMIFIYKDLEEILGAYGFEDQSKPRNSRNMKYDQLDQKSIRIMNRLQSYFENNIRAITLRELFEDKIYKKTINNSQLGNSSSKKQFKLEFIKSKDFFEILHSINVRKSQVPHQNLQMFLTIDSKIYKQGLVFKKIERLLKECNENQYLKSVGTQKKMRQSFTKQSSQIHQDQIIEEDYQYEEDQYDDIVSDKYSDKVDNKQEDLKQSPSKQQQDNINNTITRNMSEMQSPQKKDTMGSILAQTQFNSGKKCLTQMVIKEEEQQQLNSNQTQRQRTSIAEMQRHYIEDQPKKIINIDSDSQIVLRSRDGNMDSQQIVNQYSESIIDDAEDHYSEHDDGGDMEF